MIEGLVLARPDFGGNGFIPFLGVGELRVDIVDDAPERKQPMSDDLANCEFSCLHFFHVEIFSAYVAHGCAKFNLIRPYTPLTH
jgi:hypothetical protein